MMLNKIKQCITEFLSTHLGPFSLSLDVLDVSKCPRQPHDYSSQWWDCRSPSLITHSVHCAGHGTLVVLNRLKVRCLWGRLDAEEEPYESKDQAGSAGDSTVSVGHLEPGM